MKYLEKHVDQLTNIRPKVSLANDTNLKKIDSETHRSENMGIKQSNSQLIYPTSKDPQSTDSHSIHPKTLNLKLADSDLILTDPNPKNDVSPTDADTLNTTKGIRKKFPNVADSVKFIIYDS